MEPRLTPKAGKDDPPPETSLKAPRLLAHCDEHNHQRDQSRRGRRHRRLASCRAASLALSRPATAFYGDAAAPGVSGSRVTPSRPGGECWGRAGGRPSSCSSSVNMGLPYAPSQAQTTPSATRTHVQLAQPSSGQSGKSRQPAGEAGGAGKEEWVQAKARRTREPRLAPGAPSERCGGSCCCCLGSFLPTCV